MLKLLFLTSVIWFSNYAHSYSRGNLALTPPMGWNAWNTFECNIDEKLIRESADALVSSGMKDAGYEYVNIDDCWQLGRNPDGSIQVDTKKFPSGMKALADYIHSKGLKFGIYSSAGYFTCERRAASLNFEMIDAKTYADWGVDFVKYDFCFATAPDVHNTHDNTPEFTRARYQPMADAIAASGREMIFSLCSWGVGKPWIWGAEVGQLWRTAEDIALSPNWRGWTRILDQQVGLEKYAGPGHWNDPDMLIVGMISKKESIAHFSLWSLLSAPLIAGNDIRNMSKETLEILTNKEVIAVNQDPMGVQGTRYIKQGRNEVWVKPLVDGSYAVVLFNRNLLPQNISFKWSDLKLDWDTAKVRDLWKKQDLGTFSDSFSAKVEGRGAVMIKISQ
jgi:alpha-galactosidase